MPTVVGKMTRGAVFPHIVDFGGVGTNAPTAKTLSSDRLALDTDVAVYIVDGQGGADDEIDGISGYNAGQLCILRAATGRTLTLKDENAGAAAAADRIRTLGGGDQAFTDDEPVFLYHDETLDRWLVLAGPGAGAGHAEDHDHDGAPTQKLNAANTHESPSASTHHAKYLDADAVSAVEAADPLTLAGVLGVGTYAGIGVSPSVLVGLKIARTWTDAPNGHVATGLSVQAIGNGSGTTRSVKGLTGIAEANLDNKASYLLGLDFQTYLKNTVGLSNWVGARVGLVSFSGSGSVDDCIGYEILPTWIGTHTLDVFAGYHCPDLSARATGAGSNIYGFQADAFDASATPSRYPFFYGDKGTPLWYVDHDGRLYLKEAAAPGTPAANLLALYAKDKAGVSELYYKNDNGDERDLSELFVLTTRGDLIRRGASAPERVAVGADGQKLASDGTDPVWEDDIKGLEFIIDGGGSVITTGIKPVFIVPFACTITAWYVVADQSGSINVDVNRSAWNVTPSYSSIAASAHPALVGAIGALDTTLTGWTKTLAAQDILQFEVDSVATVEKCTILLKVKRT